MERKKFDAAPCSIARSLGVLGDWWTPLIIREALYGVHRFDEFQKWLGIGRNILTNRLSLLEREGLLEKRAYQERPVRYEYHLTDKGFDAAQILIAMMAFGEKWYFDKGCEPIILHDKRTGKKVNAEVVDRTTKKTINPRELYAAPGPSFPKVSAIRQERFSEHYARLSK